MNKILSVFLFVFILTIHLYSQGENKHVSKFDQFASKTKTAIKYIDYKIAELNIKTYSAESRVRKVIIGNETKYFYYISKTDQSGTISALIQYEDLLDIISALQTMLNEASSDFALKPYYLENKIITDDGFRIGYLIDDGELAWYADLNDYDPNNTIFFNEIRTFAASLNDAKNKIDSLKK